MAKMLGQDLFTQEEFDAFKATQFDTAVADIAKLNEIKADSVAVETVLTKMKKDINILFAGLAISILGNAGLIYFIAKLVK